MFIDTSIQAEAEEEETNPATKTFAIGDVCAIYSKSKQAWAVGNIEQISTTKNGTFYETKQQQNQKKKKKVSYTLNGEFLSKEVRSDDQALRAYSPEDTKIQNRVSCPCGQEMTRLAASLCYQQLKEDEHELNGSVKQKNPSQLTTTEEVICDHCGQKVQGSQPVYHCPKKKTAIHQFGYHVCTYCA
ncbi:hypothetical protein RFI_06725, partial [Reticulomyxa filosa]